MTAIWKIWSEVPGSLPPRAGGKKRFFGDRLRTLTENISAMEHDINNRNETCQFADTPLHARNLMNFGPQTAENGSKANFCPPHKVYAQDELQAHICDKFRFNHIRQMAPMVDADAKSLVSVGEAVRRGLTLDFAMHLVVLVETKWIFYKEVI